MSFEPPKVPKPSAPEGEKRVFMSDAEWDRMAVYLVGSQQRFRENVIIPTMLTPARIKTNDEKMIESAVESCAFKSVMACVLGILSAYSCFFFYEYNFLNISHLTQSLWDFQDSVWELP